jgi:hypothetical protein
MVITIDAAITAPSQRGDNGLGLQLQRRLADAFDALVGIELDEDEIGPRHVGDENLLRNDLHRTFLHDSAISAIQI